MIELVTTDGMFRLDGGEWEVTNNIWLIGDDREVVVVDAAHDAAPIVQAVNGRKVAAIALTHGHNDHINAAVALQVVVTFLFRPSLNKSVVCERYIKPGMLPLAGHPAAHCSMMRGKFPVYGSCLARPPQREKK